MSEFTMAIGFYVMGAYFLSDFLLETIHSTLIAIYHAVISFINTILHLSWSLALYQFSILYSAILPLVSRVMRALVSIHYFSLSVAWVLGYLPFQVKLYGGDWAPIILVFAIIMFNTVLLVRIGRYIIHHYDEYHPPMVLPSINLRYTFTGYSSWAESIIYEVVPYSTMFQNFMRPSYWFDKGYHYRRHPVEEFPPHFFVDPGLDDSPSNANKPLCSTPTYPVTTHASIPVFQEACALYRQTRSMFSAPAPEPTYKRRHGDRSTQDWSTTQRFTQQISTVTSRISWSNEPSTFSHRTVPATVNVVNTPQPTLGHDDIQRSRSLPVKRASSGSKYRAGKPYDHKAGGKGKKVHRDGKKSRSKPTISLRMRVLQSRYLTNRDKVEEERKKAQRAAKVLSILGDTRLYGTHHGPEAFVSVAIPSNRILSSTHNHNDYITTPAPLSIELNEMMVIDEPVSNSIQGDSSFQYAESMQVMEMDVFESPTINTVINTGHEDMEIDECCPELDVEMETEVQRYEEAAPTQQWDLGVFEQSSRPIGNQLFFSPEIDMVSTTDATVPSVQQPSYPEIVNLPSMPDIPQPQVSVFSAPIAQEPITVSTPSSFTFTYPNPTIANTITSPAPDPTPVPTFIGLPPLSAAQRKAAEERIAWEDEQEERRQAKKAMLALSQPCPAEAPTSTPATSGGFRINEVADPGMYRVSSKGKARRTEKEKRRW